jgi:PKD repeat protein
MPVTPFHGAGARIARILSIASLLIACSDRKEQEKAQPPGPPAVPAAPAVIPPPAPDTSMDSADSSGIRIDSAHAGEPQPPRPDPVRFSSRRPPKAWVGREFEWAVGVTPARRHILALADAPEGMALKGNAVRWLPGKPGEFRFALEASWLEAGRDDSSSLRQSFTVTVQPVLTLVMKPLPAQAEKGDTVRFDLRGSDCPEWAAGRIMARFDYEGDGTWDTQALPLAENQLHERVYAAVGRFSPKVEAQYGEYETRSATGEITVVGAVDAVLVVKPDTCEPGGTIKVDASGSKGDGRLTYRLDLDGDGRPEWADSTRGKGSIKAPASGRYRARLTVRNAMGQEGRAETDILVNSRPKVTLRIAKSKVDMATPVEVLVEAGDSDDSLRTIRINFTGSGEAWQVATRPDSAKGPGRWRKTFRSAYGKAGTYTVEACAASADGREVCGEAKVEIFNAPPVCDAGPALQATVGVPVEIEGKGDDPDGSIVKWEWDLDGDGKFDLASPKDGRLKYTFSRKGSFPLTLKVTTADGMTATGVRKVEVRKK